MNLISTSRISNYWDKFPVSLRVIIKVRLWTSIGAGGVLYLNPLIFNSLGFTAEQIGSGITAAAFAGITTRFCTGYFLDKKYSYRNSIKVACLIAILSDFIFYYTQNYLGYIFGQLLLGAAAGIYWPSVELAIPLNCKRVNSSEGYALARSADAIGVTLGVLIGTIGTYFEYTRIIYIIDFICMFYIFSILINRINFFEGIENIKNNTNEDSSYKEKNKISIKKLILSLIPLLSLTLFITGVMTLLQNILPLDLANGGLRRPPLTEQSVATLVTIKLIALAIFQWPIGYIIRNKSSFYKFKCCLISLILGFILLSFSTLLINGYLLILLSFIPLTISLCIFLPSASDAIIKSSPSNFQGSAIALYSQCFGVSALIVPWLAGKLIDNYDTAIELWLIVIIFCILLIPICKNIK